MVVVIQADGLVLVGDLLFGDAFRATFFACLFVGINTLGRMFLGFVNIAAKLGIKFIFGKRPLYWIKPSFYKLRFSLM